VTLHEHLLRRIRAEGPLTVAAYMQDCLLHPELGYYTTRDPLGTAGDFTTAPEISQMFGELLGLSLAQAWLDRGSPAPFTLAELGPGRGTLMADILRATRGVPGFHDAAQVVLLEASPTLRAVQAEVLTAYEPRWIDRLDELPQTPLFLVANEFFDALPIRQFLRDGDGWRERLVGAQDDTLVFGLAERAAQPALAHRLEDTRDGDLVELCEAGTAILDEVCTRIAAQGGVALCVDYGDWRSLGDTLQALRKHAHSEVLETPGQADLTAHVDFEALAAAIASAGCRFTRLTTQGVFLERLGITDRARALAARMDDAGVETLIAAHRRLTHPEEMGNLFKVLGIYAGDTPPPPGLDA
jgi:SAM-dependent MidA family methyltransferase